MATGTTPDNSSITRAERIRAVVDDCLRRRGASEPLSDDAVLDANPDLLPELADELHKVALIARARERAAFTMTTPPPGALNAQTIPSDMTVPSSWMQPIQEAPAPEIPGYEIAREIHRGGQGIVYQAVQQGTKRQVAVKVMKEGPFAGPQERARFEREVQVLGALRHPHIVTIFDSGQAAGCYFLVMDYIEGQPLDEYLKSARPKFTDTLRLFWKICDAVAAAQLLGVIHRDLKPSNVRVDTHGEPHVLDFGLAKLTQGDDPSGPMTLTGQFVGTLPWASPEQAEGEHSHIDLRTDVYSLGVMLYQILTSRFPYQVVGNMRDVLDNILRAEPARPRSISRRIDSEIETIVLKCLQKDRARRYQSAGELARDIARYLGGDEIEAKRDSLLYVIKKRARRHLAALVVMGLVAVIGLAWCYTSVRQWADTLEERAKVTQREADNQEFARRVTALAHDSAVAVRSMGFGWFLLEWQAGRTARAAEIAAALEPSSPQAAAAQLVLADSPPAVEEIAVESPARRAWLRFAVGERLLRAGQTDAARAEFAAAREGAHDDWLRDALDARLTQLAGAASGTNGGGGAP